MARLRDMIDPNERIVQVQEFCDGVLTSTFFVIHSTDFGHWRSTEPIWGLAWTKERRNRAEFGDVNEALRELHDIWRWRREEAEKAEESQDSPAEILLSGAAA